MITMDDERRGMKHEFEKEVNSENDDTLQMTYVLSRLILFERYSRLTRQSYIQRKSNAR